MNNTKILNLVDNINKELLQISEQLKAISSELSNPTVDKDANLAILNEYLNQEAFNINKKNAAYSIMQSFLYEVSNDIIIINDNDTYDEICCKSYDPDPAYFKRNITFIRKKIEKALANNPDAVISINPCINLENNEAFLKSCANIISCKNVSIQ